MEFNRVNGILLYLLFRLLDFLLLLLEHHLEQVPHRDHHLLSKFSLLPLLRRNKADLSVALLRHALIFSNSFRSKIFLKKKRGKEFHKE